jgi:hypothetical protein
MDQAIAKLGRGLIWMVSTDLSGAVWRLLKIGFASSVFLRECDFASHHLNSPEWNNFKLFQTLEFLMALGLNHQSSSPDFKHSPHKDLLETSKECGRHVGWTWEISRQVLHFLTVFFSFFLPSFFHSFFLVLLGLELRASHLKVGRCSVD